MRALGLEDLLALRQVSDPQLSPDGARVAFVLGEPDREADRITSRIALVPADGGEVTFASDGPGDTAPRWSEDGAALAWIVRADDGARVVVDGRAVTPERLRARAFFWAPDGRSIAFVATEPVDASVPLRVTRLRYKFEGQGLIRARAQLWVADVASGDARALVAEAYDVAFPAWSPDGSELAFVAADRDDADLDFVADLFAVPAGGGERRRLTDASGSVATPAWLPDGSAIVYVGTPEGRSDRMSFLYEVPSTGGTPRMLTGALDRKVIVGMPGYPGAPPTPTADGERVVFCARDRGCVHVYEVARATCEVRKLVGGDDRLATSVTMSGERLAYLVATPTVPGDIAIGGDVAERIVTGVNADALAGAAIAMPEERTFTAPDGSPIHGWVIRGRGDGPRPLLLDIHGGPHNAWGPNFCTNGRLYHQALAAAGWSVALVNTRGSCGYGDAFYRGLDERWGEADGEDFLAVVDALVADGSADPDRLAVAGNSYGGYMASWLVGHTERFKAAVTAGAVTDLASFYGSSDLGSFLRDEFGVSPTEDPDLYRRLSPLTYADRVRAPVLIMHGLGDDRVPVGQAEEWFSALRQAGATVEMILYPGGSHLFFAEGAPSQREHAARAIIDWLGTHAG